jgi:hypothetical protein
MASAPHPCHGMRQCLVGSFMSIVSACHNSDLDEFHLQRYYMSSRHDAVRPANRVPKAVNVREDVSRVANE